MSGKADRPSKRVRRLSTDSEGSSANYDWSDQRGAAAGRSAIGNRGSTRSRRTAVDNSATAIVSRGHRSSLSLSPESMRLTVKAPSSKLREATRSSPSAGREPFAGGEILEGKRSRNVKKSYVVESDSEDEDEDEAMDDLVDDEEDEEDDEDDEDMDGEDEDADADGDADVDMDAPPPPTIKLSKARSGKQPVMARQAPKGSTISVQLGSDDEELSELESEVAEEEAMQTGNEEEAEEEEDDEEEEEEVEVENEEDEESDDGTGMGGSRASTPDLNKLTKRQRARLEEGGSGHLLALPDEVQVKKHLTAEEHAMRRAEMARRRKNLSEKRNEEEKMDTINKLLKKQAPKTNARRSQINLGGEVSPDGETVKPNPLFVRWVSNKDGSFIGVPEEWLEGPVGVAFQDSVKQAGPGMGGKMIEEVS